MSEEEQKKESLKIQIGKLGYEELRELVGVIHFLSGYGLSALRNSNWEQAKKTMPVLAKMNPDLEVHVRMGEICHELFSDWLKEIIKDADPNWETKPIHLEDFYELGKGKKMLSDEERKVLLDELNRDLHEKETD